MSHPCPGPRCGHQVDDDKLMCLPHWNLVPADARRAVYATWKRVRETPTPDRVAALRAAQRVAIESVGGTP